MSTEKQYLTTAECAAIAGTTSQKIRLLIEANKLAAVNTSTTNNRPRWSVRRCDLLEFLTPASVSKSQAKQKAAERRQRIDAGVKQVYA
jgi:hypothetical protein